MIIVIMLILIVIGMSMMLYGYENNKDLLAVLGLLIACCSIYLLALVK